MGCRFLLNFLVLVEDEEDGKEGREGKRKEGGLMVSLRFRGSNGQEGELFWFGN
jgi:hypothetical protein